MGCVWPVALVTTQWEIICIKELEIPPQPYQHFRHCMPEETHDKWGEELHFLPSNKPKREQNMQQAMKRVKFTT